MLFIINSDKTHYPIKCKINGFFETFSKIFRFIVN